MSHAKTTGATHVIHVQNINDFEHFPLYVPAGTDAERMFKEHCGGGYPQSAYRLRGVYRVDIEWESQLKGWNIYNW